MAFYRNIGWKIDAVALVVFLLPLQALAETGDRPVRVATTSCPPFVIVDGDDFRGLSVFLWDEIAKSLRVDYEMQEYSLQEMVDAVATGKTDVAVSCLSITREREEIVDFSHSYYETNLSIGTKERGAVTAITGVFLSKEFLVAIGIVLGAAVLIGGIFYSLEHRDNTKLYAMKTRAGKLVEAFMIGLLFVTRGPIRSERRGTLRGSPGLVTGDSPDGILLIKIPEGDPAQPITTLDHHRPNRHQKRWPCSRCTAVIG